MSPRPQNFIRKVLPGVTGLALFALTFQVKTAQGAEITETTTLGTLLDQRCSKQIRVPGQQFSSDGRIRADQIVFCVPRQADGAILTLRTSAMHNERFRGNNQSPWINLRIIDAKGNTLLEDKTFALADVASCGGYQQHVFRVPTPFDPNSAFDVRISMGGSSPDKGCTPTGTDKLVRDLQTSIRRYLRGDFTEEERNAISLLVKLLGA
jgi:hypothetical protein